MPPINPLFARWMSQTGKLVQSGRLKDVTAAIQNALRGLQGAVPPAPSPTASPVGYPSSMRFDGLVREVRPGDEAGQAQLHPAAHGQAPAGEFTPQLHTSPTGIRTCKLYVPRGFGGKQLFPFSRNS